MKRPIINGEHRPSWLEHFGRTGGFPVGGCMRSTLADKDERFGNRSLADSGQPRAVQVLRLGIGRGLRVSASQQHPDVASVGTFNSQPSCNQYGSGVVTL